jgi:hypothetical protein
MILFHCHIKYLIGILFIYFAVLGFELGVYTLRHPTSPFFVMGFFDIGSFFFF